MYVIGRPQNENGNSCAGINRHEVENANLRIRHTRRTPLSRQLFSGSTSMLSPLSTGTLPIRWPFGMYSLTSALYHATAFPLRHVVKPGMSLYDAVRERIFESVVEDPSSELHREVMDTLKWLAYEKWDGVEKDIPPFQCPHCAQDVATLQFDAEKGECPQCKGHLFLTDMLGFHQVMAPDAAPDIVVTDYMSVHETLLLFTGVRYFWERNKALLSKSLAKKRRAPSRSIWN